MAFDRPAPVQRSPARGVLASAAAHALLLVVALIVARSDAPSAGADAVFRPEPTTMVWVPSSKPAGGGGSGGGDPTPAPVRRGSRPGADAVTVPVATAASTATPTPAMAPPPQQLALSAQPMASGLASLAGVIDANRPEVGAQGAGSGAGADGTAGAAIGQGRGPGDGGGSGGERGEVGPPGNGVSWPRLVRDVKPQYTPEAMRARVTGAVGMSCVVERDGSVRDCRVTRSLDPAYGLDAEALRVVRQWRFEPARRQAEPVAVRVTIELAFSMR